MGKLRYSPWLIIHPLSWSVRARQKCAKNLLRQRLSPDADVLELGCGSGLLAQALQGHFRSYYGIDIARNAITRARLRLSKPGFSFEEGDVLRLPLPKTECAIFLGLTDWLGDGELDQLIARLNSRYIFFSFTAASRLNPYRLYRLIIDRPDQDYRPRARTYDENEIRSILTAHGYSFEWVAKPSFMNPGALVWAEKSR